ncbi:hypothetical protein THAOC_03066, partial [Thalassiosira oceanica]
RALRRLRRLELEAKGRELQDDSLVKEDDASTAGIASVEDVPTANIHNQDDHARPSDPSGGGNGVGAGHASQAQTSNVHSHSGHDTPESTASLSAGTEEEGQDTIIECDPNVLSLNQLIHCNAFLEANKDDADGLQGGQEWRPPTRTPTTSPTDGPTASPTQEPSAGPTQSPTHSPSSPPTPAPSDLPSEYPSLSPSTLEPTEFPTFNPTLRGDPWVLRGTIYYDRNANRIRDTVDTYDMGRDVEHNFGLGGVTVELHECDPDTNKALAQEGSDSGYGRTSFASTISLGYDVVMRSALAPRNEGGGKYNLINIMVDRSYFIVVRAPDGFLLTGGVCNDAVPEWRCRYTAADIFVQAYNTNGGRRGRRSLLSRHDYQNLNFRGLSRRLIRGSSALDRRGLSYEEDANLGIREGRSERCVSVDRSGFADSLLNVGVLRVGDNQLDFTEVEMDLDLDGQEASMTLQDRLLRKNARPIEIEDGLTTFTLLQSDKDAIGEITAEVLASAIEANLSANGVELDEVNPIDVLFVQDGSSDDSDLSSTHEKTSAADGSDSGISKRRNKQASRLSVKLVVRGHYDRELDVDFDAIVQDSINRKFYTIRRELTFYNQYCRDQTTKVLDLGFKLEDFSEIRSKKGVDKPAQRLIKGSVDDDDDAFSSACAQERILPEYFDASLNGLEIKAKPKMVTYIVEDGSGPSLGMVIGIVVGVAVVALGILAFAYNRKKKNEPKALKATPSENETAPTSQSGGHALREGAEMVEHPQNNSINVLTSDDKSKPAKTASASTSSGSSSERHNANSGSEERRGAVDIEPNKGSSDHILSNFELHMRSSTSKEEGDPVSGEGVILSNFELHMGLSNGSTPKETTAKTEEESPSSDCSAKELNQVKIPQAILEKDRRARAMTRNSLMQSFKNFDDATRSSTFEVPKIISLNFSSSSNSSSDSSSDSSCESSSDEDEDSVDVEALVRERRMRRAADKKKREAEMKPKSVKNNNEKGGKPKTTQLRRSSKCDLAIEDIKRKESSKQKRKNAKGSSHDDLALEHRKMRSNKKTREQSTTEDLAANSRRKKSSVEELNQVKIPQAILEKDRRARAMNRNLLMQSFKNFDDATRSSTFEVPKIISLDFSSSSDSSSESSSDEDSSDKKSYAKGGKSKTTGPSQNRKLQRRSSKCDLAIEDIKRKESSKQKRKNAKGSSHDDLALEHRKMRSYKKTREQSTTEDLAANGRRKNSKKKKGSNKASRRKPGSQKEKDRLASQSKPKKSSMDPERSGRPALRRLHSKDDSDIEFQLRKKASKKRRAKIRSDTSI